MNKTRCPWCGKLINKENDIKKYRQKYITIHVGDAIRYNGICSHCGKIYSKLPNQVVTIFLFLSSVVGILLGIFFDFLPLLVFALIFLGSFIVVSITTMMYRRIDSGNRYVVRYDREFKVKIYVIQQYYEISQCEILLLFSKHDEQEPFSSVSPIFISRFDKKANIIEGYWLYDHCDNAYFASLDCVHLYDDDGNIVADITFKEPK